MVRGRAHGFSLPGESSILTRRGAPLNPVAQMGATAGTVDGSGASSDASSNTAITIALATASMKPAIAAGAVPGRAVSPTANPTSAGRIDSEATVIAITATAPPRRSPAA